MVPQFSRTKGTWILSLKRIVVCTVGYNRCHLSFPGTLTVPARHCRERPIKIFPDVLPYAILRLRWRDNVKYRYSWQKPGFSTTPLATKWWHHGQDKFQKGLWDYSVYAARVTVHCVRRHEAIIILSLHNRRKRNYIAMLKSKDAGLLTFSTWTDSITTKTTLTMMKTYTYNKTRAGLTVNLQRC